MRYRVIVGVAVVCSAFFGCPPIPPPKPLPPRPFPQLEDSFVAVPVQVPLEPIRAAVDSQLPNPLVEKASAPRNCDTYRVEKRAPVGLDVAGNVAKVSIPLSYKVKVHLFPYSVCFPDASCGMSGGMVGIDVALSSTLNWSDQYCLNSQTASSVTPVSRCLLTILQIDGTDHVAGIFRSLIDARRGDVDSAMCSRTSFRSQANSAWESMSAPIRVAEGLWLKINPQEFSVGPVAGSSGSVSVPIALRARPELVASSAAPPSTKSPLPPLRTAPVASGFRIALEGSVTMKEATELARKQLVGKLFAFEGRKVTVRDAEVYGAGGGVAVKISVDGDVDGVLYLIGTPTLQNSRDLTVPDLDFSVETKDVLVKIGAWVLRGRIQNDLGALLSFPLDPQFAKAREQLNEQLNKRISPNVQLRGRVDSLRPIDGIDIRPAEIRARVEAVGELAVELSP